MTEQYPVDLYAADGKMRDEAFESERQALRKEAKPEPRQDAEPADKAVAKNFGGTKGGVEVRSASPQPKELRRRCAAQEVGGEGPIREGRVARLRR